MTTSDEREAPESRVPGWWLKFRTRFGSDDEVSSSTSGLVAAAALAVSLYLWPSWYILPAVVFYPVATLVWCVVYAAVIVVGKQAGASRMIAVLQEGAHRTGLALWEWAGAVLGAALCAAAILAPPVLPLGLACLYGFGTLLWKPIRARELRRLRPPAVIPLPTVDPDNDDYVEREFRWRLRIGTHDDAHQLTVPIHLPTYRSLRAREPKFRWDGSEPRLDLWVVQGATTEVDVVASNLQEISESKRYATFAEVSNGLAFVQSITYKTDEESTGREEYWRYPIETMHDNEGDCDDTTILAAAILRRLGHRVGTVHAPGHAALAVEVPTGTPGVFLEADGRRMYYCETTAEGWDIGEVPESLRGKPMQLTMVPPG